MMSWIGRLVASHAEFCCLHGLTLYRVSSMLRANTMCLELRSVKCSTIPVVSVRRASECPHSVTPWDPHPTSTVHSTLEQVPSPLHVHLLPVCWAVQLQEPGCAWRFLDPLSASSLLLPSFCGQLNLGHNSGQAECNHVCPVVVGPFHSCIYHQPVFINDSVWAASL